jgi:hypothetical protein
MQSERHESHASQFDLQNIGLEALEASQNTRMNGQTISPITDQQKKSSHAGSATVVPSRQPRAVDTLHGRDTSTLLASLRMRYDTN